MPHSHLLCVVYNDRMKQNQMHILEWAEQQKREKAAAAQAERDEEAAYANQETNILRMRSMLEDDSATRKAAYMKQIQMENRKMA